jgi:hypothetical protein
MVVSVGHYVPDVLKLLHTNVEACPEGNVVKLEAQSGLELLVKYRISPLPLGMALRAPHQCAFSQWITFGSFLFLLA